MRHGASCLLGERAAVASVFDACPRLRDEGGLRAAVHEAARQGAGGGAEWLPFEGADGGSSAAERHFAAVRELTAAHLVEMWALRLFGPQRLEAELCALAGRLRGDAVADS